MRKTLLLFTMLFSAVSLFAQTVAQKAAGNYSGILYVNLYEPINDESLPLPETDDEGDPIYDGNDNQVNKIFEVVIESQAENTVKFGLYNFGFLGMNLGDIVLENVPVEEQADGSVKFGENSPVSFRFLVGEEGEEDEILATAKINEENSYIKGDYAYIDVDVVWTNSSPDVEDSTDDSDDVPIYVRFQGTDAVKTGIASVGTATVKNKAFDLQGRRIEKMQNGISIVNGKKILK